MAQVHHVGVLKAQSAPLPPGKRMLIRANIRIRGSRDSIALTIRNISSIGLVGRGERVPFPGAKVEIELRNLGLVTATIINVVDGEIHARFDQVIDPEAVQTKVTGSYESSATTKSSLRLL